ncbi:hypothetical protein GE061_014905 [Apolygus lucorum]|uniref:Heparanase n=1 Tax=Apolygus lucorum TaxID=248454 RepID=A0A8S9XLK7_APOLU|nr:hypothetical protein GE061_014905 [Apolygus lucorum]
MLQLSSCWRLGWLGDADACDLTFSAANMDWKWVLLLPHILSFYITLGSEVVVQVNTKKWIYYVPERFLSLTVDPLTLAAASPLTQESYNMAKGLSPSFVRIGGIGTNALIFGKEFMVNSSTVSEGQWDSVNDFARGTGLDIIASLNPSMQVQGVWDSQNSLELISYSNKKKFNVVWQLGYDVRGYNASGAEIGRDLVRLAKILDGFPMYAGSPVFSPDISSVSGAKQIHFFKDLITNSGNSLGSVILQPKFTNDGEPEDPYELISSMTNELDTYVWNKEIRVGRATPKKPVWIAEPTASKGSFSDAVKFVKRIGVAARMGIQIYMRQAGAIALKSPTPEFWFSLLYKNLVGQGVLDNKIVSQNHSEVHMFAHCTASLPEERSILDSDWNYEKGAVTLFGVNESPEPVKLMLKVTSKEEPLHIYVLTSGEKSGQGKNPTLLNGQELMLSPTWDLPVLSPKVKRPSKSASVTLPGESIFFIVMPDSKIRTCSVPPLVTPDLNLSELSKRLRLGPRKPETLEEEQEIEPSEDLANEGVFLNKLAEGVKEELKEEDQLEFDAKKEKYEPLTKAITNAKHEESSVKPEAVSVDPDVIKIEPLVETSNIPFVNSSQEKSVSRMRRSSNEDPIPPIPNLKEGTVNEPGKTNAALESKVDNSYHISVSVIYPEVESDEVDNKTRSTRHISDTTEEESDDLIAQRSDGAKKIAAEEVSDKDKEKDSDDEEDVEKKTLALAKVVEETEKVDQVSEGSEGVVVPLDLPDEKISELMLETAKRKSEPETDPETEDQEAGSNIDEVERSKDDNPSSSVMVVTPVAPVESSLSMASGYSQVSTSGQSQLAAPNTENSKIRIITMQQVKDPVVNRGLPEGQDPPKQQVVDNPIIEQPEPQQQVEPISSQVRNNHILKISLPVPTNDVFNVENSATSVYNEQKEIAINSIMSKMVSEGRSKSSVVSSDAKPVGTEGALVLVSVPGNDTVLMAPEDVKLLNRGGSEGVKTLENGDPVIELNNEEDAPKTIMARQVVTTAPITVRISATPSSQTATLSAPAEQATSTPPGPVSPLKASADSKSSKINQIREPLKAPTPEELRERFKSLREKMLELRSQYVAAREKRLEDIKKQVASRGPPLPLPSSEGDDPIKNTIKRREAELKEWFKKFDKREAQTTQIVVPVSAETDMKPRPRRLSLFTNDEGVDMAKFFEEETSESNNYKRSPEMNGRSDYQYLPVASASPDSPKLGPMGKRIFPLDSKTHGIVYNNKIYPAKLFSYIDQPDSSNMPMKVESEGYSTTTDGGSKDLETSTEIPKSRGRIAFVPRDAFLREMKSDFIPVIIIPPDESDSSLADDLSPPRAKRSTLGSLEDQFHQLKEELLPKISSWFKDLNDKAPWKRDLERSGRHRRSVEDFVRTNDIRSLFTPQKLIRNNNLGTKEIQELVVNNIDKGEDEVYAVAKKYSDLPEKIVDQILPEPLKRNSEVPETPDDTGYCEEVGTSKESIIRDPFIKPGLISTKPDRTRPSTNLEDAKDRGSRKINESEMKPPLSSPDTFEESMIASVISERISDFFTSITNWLGISPTRSS